MTFAADWVQSYTGRTLTDFQRSAVEILCAFKGCGPYDFGGTFRRADWEHGHGVSFVVRGHFATFDGDGLTRLVVLAHDRCIRVEIEGCGPGLIRVSMWPRKGREGRMHERHPTLEGAAEKIRPEVKEPTP